MFLKSLSLTNYRNYQKLNLEFTTPITVLVGDNAQGKSNLLESIYFLATTKSLKADEDQELIAYDQDFTRVAGEISLQQTAYSKPPENTFTVSAESSQQSAASIKLEIVMQLQQQQLQGSTLPAQLPSLKSHTQGSTLIKRVKINGIPRRVLDYIGHLYVVAFSPEDISLVTGPPALRRWHVDMTIAQVDREYKKALTQYGEIVTRKNRLLKHLKEGTAQPSELDYWADQQIIFGNLVSKRRRDFFDYLNACERNFPLLNETIEYKYLENPISKERLDSYRDKEIWNSTSLIGPHRDDFRFLSRNSLDQTRDLSRFGSRGEQRTAVLDLKLSEVSFVQKVTGSRPVLLLDDVFSELDQLHRQHVIKLLSLQQTIIASVQLDKSLITELGDKLKIWNIKEGALL